MASKVSSKILFIFLDGVGVAANSGKNPFSTASMPTLNSLLNGSICQEQYVSKEGLLYRGIDACLGVKGLPQSATGQTALLTGINASRELGFHLPAFPNQNLVELIKKHNIFSKALAVGAKAIFANSYSSVYFELIKQHKRRHSVTTHCVLASGLCFRTIHDLHNGGAVHWDMTRQTLLSYVRDSIPVISYYQAGKDLAGITTDYNLVLYESFVSDLIGHSKSLAQAEMFLSHLDEFLKGVLDNLSKEVTLVISSDHGNLEDMSTTQHTRNPVPLLVYGQKALYFWTAESITDVTPAIIEVLSSG
jgi:2,3-bisphosphoglycerate-independent phosphoglycerate mutase